jgi:hypothetical protein
MLYSKVQGDELLHCVTWMLLDGSMREFEGT